MCLAPHLKWLPWSLEQKPEKFPMRLMITKLVREFAMFVKFIPRRVRRIGGGKNSDANRDAGRLPDVSRPAICSQQLMGAGTNSRYFRVRGAPDVPVLPDKMRGKLRNVFAAFRECGHLQWKDVQAVKQIFPESSFFDLLAQIAVGGGNDPHIHLDHSASTEPLDLSSLNHA